MQIDRGVNAQIHAVSDEYLRRWFVGRDAFGDQAGGEGGAAEGDQTGAAELRETQGETSSLTGENQSERPLKLLAL